MTPATSDSGTPIDRITLAGDVFAPRSALLHLRSGDRPGMHDCSWWIDAAARRLPARIVASDAAMSFRGETTRGTVITGKVRIADRRDDLYGTELLLAGLGAPLIAPTGPASGDLSASVPSQLRHEELAMTHDGDRVDILTAARTNEAFRREILTGAHEQVVVMAIPPGGEIGDEVHPATDQLLLFVDGRGEARVDGEVSPVGPNDLVFVRSGTRHNFVNTGERPLRLITVYAPPQHPPGTIHQTKADADAAEA